MSVAVVESKAKSYTREDIQYELGRRKMFPATTEQLGLTKAQKVTVADLALELLNTSADDKNRGWRAYELALAAEHYRLTPKVPFVRQVPV